MKNFVLILCLTVAAQPALARNAVKISNAGETCVGRTSIGAPQEGEVFTHKEAGVEFTVPKDWKATPDGDVLTVSTPDGALQMVFWVPDADTFNAAVKDIDKELNKVVKNIKVTSISKEDTHNGMAHHGKSGTGKVDGVTISWTVDVLSAKKPLIILTFAAPGLFEKHAADYSKLVGSIKKIK